MDTVRKLKVIPRAGEMKPLMEGMLPGHQRYAISISGEPTPRALRHIEEMVALTRSFIEEDEAAENAENRDGDGI